MKPKYCCDGMCNQGRLCPNAPDRKQRDIETTFIVCVILIYAALAALLML